MQTRSVDGGIVGRQWTALRVWLPVMAALVLAIAAGWSIMRLNAAAYRSSQNRSVVTEVVADLRQPQGLLLQSSKQRLEGSVQFAGMPRHMAAYYHGVFDRLDKLAASSGERRSVAAATAALRLSATTQDSVFYAEGSTPFLAAQRAPAVVAKLWAAFAVLDAKLAAHERWSSRLARGGTMAIMLLGALSLIVLLRRFDRVRSRMTSELHVLATHDPLTGLPNRRQLTADLADLVRAATLTRPARIVIFDLDGFKAYNDAFGHHAGVLILARLGHALSIACIPGGTCYRLGGDEFCALFADGADEHVVERCRNALSETGEGFAIVSSFGSSLIPSEAADSDLAMQLADERMYAAKNSGRASAGQQARDLALKVLNVQEPEVDEHSARVAARVANIAVRLGLSDAEITDLVRAAELHDIGKIAIPYAILHKPGPLDALEWEIMRRHPTVGASILGAAPALAEVATIVRASHERYDGTGYPLGLSGDDIPLASRIVFVCDSFDALVSERPYSAAMSEERAIEELRRNAGRQFDPDVVAAFCAEHRAHRNAETAGPTVRLAA